MLAHRSPRLLEQLVSAIPTSLSHSELDQASKLRPKKLNTVHMAIRDA